MFCCCNTLVCTFVFTISFSETVLTHFHPFLLVLSSPLSQIHAVHHKNRTPKPTNMPTPRPSPKPSPVPSMSPTWSPSVSPSAVSVCWVRNIILFWLIWIHFSFGKHLSSLLLKENMILTTCISTLVIFFHLSLLFHSHQLQVHPIFHPPPQQPFQQSHPNPLH